MGVDQKNGPFWGLYYSIFLIVYRGPKGAHNFDQPPHGSAAIRSIWGVVLVLYRVSCPRLGVLYRLYEGLAA